ncbi:MAG: LacI family DNA-binding transcriptional regulator [Candidatus Latescibacteria bacterium]|nr:LacI family DNA-binding transcriptional regulator [Candidatus Latescibacterota bacterium]
MAQTKITLKNIAEKAGVSIATVSMVLNNKAAEGTVQISDQTVQKVRRIAQESGYMARRQKVVGLILTWLRDATEVPMMQRLIEALREGDNVHLAMSLTTRACPRVELEELHIAEGHKYDGVIMEPSFALLQQLADRPDLLAAWKNLVFINRYPGSGVPSVTIDHEECGRLAAQHLLERGHRKLAFMEGHLEPVPESYRPASEKQIVQHRYAGFKAVVEAAGGRAVLLRDTGEVLAAKESVSGVYCAHTRGSTALVNACWRAGVEVPRQLSIVGQDDEFAKEMARPAISAIDVRAREVGQRAASMVLNLIEGRPARSTVLKPRLLERDSVAPQ